jgi:hypothetical protein
MVDLKAFENDLRAQHAALTKTYEEKHVAGEKAWSEYEQAKTALVAFRTKYGKVLKALDNVKVEG